MYNKLNFIANTEKRFFGIMLQTRLVMAGTEEGVEKGRGEGGKGGGGGGGEEGGTLICSQATTLLLTFH